MKFEEILPVLNQVPDYQVFLTVDELKKNSYQLAHQYPEIVEIIPLGHSGNGDSIEVMKIGEGHKKALLFAMPHPNEPIGSMMLEYLSQHLVENETLRQRLDYTWYLIKCIDPDGTRLNEGWFKYPFSIKTYASHFYRSPAFQQVEWTFPIDYKTLHFHQPLPETQGLMTLMQQVEFDFLYSLHNSGFGGSYFYISEEAASLYEPFYQLVASQGLPLHLGEPEIPYVTQYAKAIFKLPFIEEGYDFLEKQIGIDPAQVISGGTSSFDYVRRFSDPFCLVCEVPYFFNPAIQDTTPSNMIRREAILQGTTEAKEDLHFFQEQYQQVYNELTLPSPFRASIEEYLRSFPKRLTSLENWAQTNSEMVKKATVAEKFDSLLVQKFYRLRNLGMLIRMLDTQITKTGMTPILATVRQVTQEAFVEKVAHLETALNYSVIPIQKLVRVQLGSALLAVDYAAGR